MSRYLVLLSLALLTGCASAPPIPSPTIVRVPVVQYVAVPAPLTVACPIAQPSDRTIGTLVGIAYARKQALEHCNAQLDAIRTLGQHP